MTANRTRVRVDGRAVQPRIAPSCDTMVGTTKAASTSASTLGEGLTDTPEMEVMTAMAHSTEERRRIAGEYLLRARDDLERAARTRVTYTLNARRYGLTNADIGAFLGISESAVRGLIARHGGDS